MVYIKVERSYCESYQAISAFNLSMTYIRSINYFTCNTAFISRVLNWLPLQSRFTYHVALLVFKMI